MTFQHVILKGLFHLSCKFLIVYYGISLKIKSETSVVEISRAYAGNFSIYHQCLCVKKSVIIYPYSGA